jgi:prepilin-type N-terminal cleavage/methylation domain-containing protein
MKARARRDGFTLIELMVTMVIAAFVALGALLILGTMNTAFLLNSRKVDMQEDARLALEMMVGDARMSGFLVPAMGGMGSVDGGAAAADVFCASDPAIIGAAAITSATAPLNAAPLIALADGSDKAVTLSAGSMDIDGDGDVDFVMNGGIIISDGNDTHCGRITAVNAGGVDFTPATPAGFQASPPLARAVPAVVYEQNGLQLMRNGVVLSNVVEDLQVEFGLDLDGDDMIEPGAGEFPIHDLTGNDSSLLRRVQLSVVTRTSMPDPDQAGGGRQATANRTGAPPDGFARRRYVVSVMPRNLQR